MVAALNILWSSSSMTDHLLCLRLFLVILSVSRGSSSITCDDPPTPAGGELSQLTNNVFNPGEHVSFTCKPGFLGSTGTLKLVCNEEGDWASQGYCVRKKCPSLGELQNGYIQYGDLGNLFGSSVSFICNDGFKLVGSDSSECIVHTDKTMMWSNPMPFCIAVSCAPPRSIEHGFYKPLKEVYQNLDVVTYECIPNANVPYSLVGTRERICSNGSWTGEEPLCKMILCPNPNIIEGGYITTRPKKVYVLGDKVQVACRAGYTLSGDERGSTCSANSRWDPKLPKCLPAVEIGTPASGEDVVTWPGVESSTTSTTESSTGSRPSDWEVTTTTQGTTTREQTGDTTTQVTPEGEDDRPTRRLRTTIIVVSIFFGITFILFLCMFMCL